ncbi:hypothetical protein MCEMOHM34_01435 [Candidatus Methylopumilus universalis]|uniref:hypothetical protein n=1 Tax=Candidatus Methylopumilus universalis TaxID=2588536 RepID=UPI003BEEFDC1
MARRTVTDLLYSIQQLGLEAKLIKHELHDGAIDLDHRDEIIEHTIERENEAPHEARAGEINPQKTELSFFAKLSQEIMTFKENYGESMNPEELQKEIKNIIEPILFSWIKENMPTITKDVLTEVVKENNKNKIETMLASWINENMANITKEILVEVVKKNKIDQKLLLDESQQSE